VYNNDTHLRSVTDYTEGFKKFNTTKKFSVTLLILYGFTIEDILPIQKLLVHMYNFATMS
jgi:hypothetical protein